MKRNKQRVAFAAVLVAFAAVSGSPRPPSPRRCRSRCAPTSPGPVINPNVYGQFAEHLGAGIYEGVWVGANSNIPNKNGYRTDVVDALRDLKVPVVRWPGGCFADEYHWRKGVGPGSASRWSTRTGAASSSPTSSARTSTSSC